MPSTRCAEPAVAAAGLGRAAAAALVIAALVSVACSPSGAPSGQELFARHCSVCHGPGGEGQPDWHVRKDDGTLPAPPLNGDGHTWHHADGLLYRIVSQGGQVFEDPSYPSFRSAMPAFGDRLSRTEIVAVLTYIKGLWEDKTKRGLSIRESQAEVSQQDPFPPD